MLIIDSCQALTPDTEGSQVALRSKMSIFAPDSPPGRRFALPVGGQSLTGQGHEKSHSLPLPFLAFFMGYIECCCTRNTSPDFSDDETCVHLGSNSPSMVSFLQLIKILSTNQKR